MAGEDVVRRLGLARLREDWAGAVQWALVLAAVGLLAARLPEVIEVNAWSVGYARYALGEGPPPGEPPAGHRRAAIWLAREALAVGRAEEALRLVEPLAEAGDRVALRLQGEALAAMGDFEGAVRAWVRGRDFNSLQAAGNRAAQEGRLEEALVAFRAAYGIDPERGAMRLADFLWWPYRSHATGVAVLYQALGRFPNSAYRVRWLVRLGDFLRSEGRYQEAEDAYRQALTLQKDFAEAHIGLGWVRYERGDGLEAAVAAFQEAIARAPDRGEGYYALGQVYAREERFEEADRWFGEALARNPGARWWYLGRANTARQAGNLDLALAVYEEAAARFPEWAPVYYEWAWALNMAGEVEEAVRIIDRAVELEGGRNVDYLMRAGQIHEGAGDLGGAAQYYRAVLELQPEHRGAKEGVQRLEDKTAAP